MKRAIITGATGAIGTALIKELIKNNIEVLVFAREGSARNSKIPFSPLVTVKYCSLEDLADIQNDTGKEYDVFYHFAWGATTGAGRNDVYLQNLNVKYALDAVGAAKRFGCTAFIGAGSQAEYGRSETDLSPETPAFPETGYGMAKLCAGELTRMYAHQLGLRHIWVRILSVYGPNDGENSLVMFTINKLLAGEAPRLTKGEQIWDYLYSGDAAKAFLAIGKKGIDSKTYVLGGGNARPLADYIKDIRDVVSPNGELLLGANPYPENQVMYLKADISELTGDTGWVPTKAFKDGIKEILNTGSQ